MEGADGERENLQENRVEDGNKRRLVKGES